MSLHRTVYSISMIANSMPGGFPSLAVLDLPVRPELQIEDDDHLFESWHIYNFPGLSANVAKGKR